MINKKENYRNYIISGAFITLSFLILGVFVSILGKEKAIFSSSITVHTKLTNARNLKEGVVVYLRGIKVGSISSINFKSLNTLLVSMDINEIYKRWIKTNSIISIQTQGVLGDKYLEISGGTTEADEIKNGEFLITNEAGTIDRIVTKSEDILLSAARVIFKLEDILNSVESDALSQAIQNINNLTNSLNKSSNKVDKIKFLKFNESISKLNVVTDNLSNISDQIKNGPGSLHSLIYDQSVHEDLQTLLGGATRSKVLKYFIRESIKKSETIKQ